MGLEITVQRRANHLVDDLVDRFEAKVELVQKHTEHVGHEPEHNLPAATAIDALSVAGISEEPPERVIEASGMLPKVHLGCVCGGAPERQQGRLSLPLAHPALEPPQHGRDDLLWGDPRRAALQTVVTQEPR